MVFTLSFSPQPLDSGGNVIVTMSGQLTSPVGVPISIWDRPSYTSSWENLGGNNITDLNGNYSVSFSQTYGLVKRRGANTIDFVTGYNISDPNNPGGGLISNIVTVTLNPPTDWIVGTMLLLKNGWSLNPPLDSGTVKFTTGLYQEQLGTPQISVTPLVEPVRVMNIGSTPYHFIHHIAQIYVWVRPPTGDSTSLGAAKNARYQLLQETERILRSGSTSIPGIQFERYSDVMYREYMQVRPPLLTAEMRAVLYDFRGSEAPTLPVKHIPGSLFFWDSGSFWDSSIIWDVTG